MTEPTIPSIFPPPKKQAHTAIHRVNLKKNQNISIDEKHSDIMNEFYVLEEFEVPKLKEERAKLKNRLKLLTETNLDEYMDICDKIKKITEEIKQKKNKKKKYLMENSAFIFNYFEEKKNIATGGVVAAAPKTEEPAPKANKVHSFFKIKKSEKSPVKEESIYNDKYRASRQYWANVNSSVINIQDYIISNDICQKCMKGELISQEDEGVLICNECGVFVQHIIDCEKPSYKEPPSEVSYTAYLRLNHFKEILSQFQAKETTQIPDEVIEAIRGRIKKERITDLSEITYTKTRDILRKLGYNKYFEHIQYINCKFGIKPPTMSEELIETLCVLFIEIQAPWALHCPSTRTNFFNYAYTLFQLCKLLDQTQFLPFIPMMKDAEKGKEQDTIWRKVCDELDWYFYPSV